MNIIGTIKWQWRTFTRSLVLCLLFCTGTAFAVDKVSIKRINAEITVDGHFDEAVWQEASQLYLDYETRPRENEPAEVKTLVRYFENGDTMFVAFTAYDPNPENIRAFFNDRDRVDRDDMVGIKLDPYNDHRLVFQFFVNPHGVQIDSTEDVISRSESAAWDAIWESKGIITDEGYQVEVAIPLRNFNFNPVPGKQTWAVEFVRFHPRSERVRLSNIKINRNNDCWACQMAELEGFEGIEQGKSLAIVPNLVMGHSRTRDLPDEPTWNKGESYSAGLDIKWGISSDIFLNATINPDFSQIEADAAQLGVNNNFTLFFDEKRPFFLENQDMFNTNFNLVHTRNIGEPDIGAKLTGRSGKHAYGLFVTDDKKATFILPGNRRSSVAELEEKSNNAALRYRFDANDALSLGLLGTFRKTDNYHNYLGSVDVRYRITEQDLFRFQAITTETEYPDFLAEEFCDEDDCVGTTEDCTFGNCATNEIVLRTAHDGPITDQAYRIRYNHDERDWFTYWNYVDIGRDFRADLGFESNIDRTTKVIGGGLIFYGEADDWWTKAELRSDWDMTHNDAGAVIEKEFEVFFWVQGPLQSFIETGCFRNTQVGNRIDASKLDIRNNTTLFEQDVCLVYGNVQPLSGLFLESEILYGDRIDFANNRLGKRLKIESGIEYSFNTHLRMEADYEYQRLRADGAEVFTAQQLDLRLKYNMDLRNSIKFSLIYTDIDFNLLNQPGILPDDLPFESSKDVSTQLIYSYKVNPQTVFFAGYSDHALKNDDVTSLRHDDRNLFMKFSYAWLQ